MPPPLSESRSLWVLPTNAGLETSFSLPAFLSSTFIVQSLCKRKIDQKML